MSEKWHRRNAAHAPESSPPRRFGPADIGSEQLYRYPGPEVVGRESVDGLSSGKLRPELPPTLYNDGPVNSPDSYLYSFSYHPRFDTGIELRVPNGKYKITVKMASASIHYLAWSSTSNRRAEGRGFS